MRWVILDLGELPCLIDVSKLNPGPSGEDADAGRSNLAMSDRLVRRQCALGLVDIGALSELPRQKPVCSTCAHAARREKQERS